MRCLITVSISHFKIRQEMFSGIYNQDALIHSLSSFVTCGLGNNFCCDTSLFL